MARGHRKGKADLVGEVIRGGRQFSIGSVLFHSTAGDILGVNVTDMKCLDAMILNGTMTPTELSKHTGLSSGATTAMIDRLENAGLIRRRPHAVDRRGTTLVLTQTATRKLAELFESMGRAMNDLVGGYSERELLVLADYFAKVEALWRTEREKLRARAPSLKATGRVRRRSR